MKSKRLKKKAIVPVSPRNSNKASSPKKSKPVTRPPSQDSIELAGDAAFITEAVTKAAATDNGGYSDDDDFAVQPSSST